MSGSPRSNAYLHLVRLEGEGLSGWQLRFPPWHPHGNLTLYFSDSFYGGQKASYEAARRRRDLDFQAAGLPLRQKGNTRHSRNTSGLVGVMLAFNPKRPGVSAFSWVALWSEDLKPRKKSFGVARLGFAQALDAAIAWRCAKTGLGFSEDQRRQAMTLQHQVIAHVRKTNNLA